MSYDPNNVVSKVVTLKSSSAKSESSDTFDQSAADAYKLSGVSPQLRRSITMKFLSGANGVKSKTKDDVTAYDVFSVARPPYNMKNVAKLYDASSYHRGAVDAKVSNIVGLGFKFLHSSKTKYKIEELEGDKAIRARRKADRVAEYMLELFESFNTDSSFLETLIKVATDYEAIGNAFIEVGRDNRGNIGYIGHVPAHTMRVRLQRDGFVQIVGKEVTYFRNYGDTKSPDPIGKDPRPNEIIHIKVYSPIDDYYGVPSVISAKSAVAGNEFSSRYNLDYFENKAVPRYLITLKGATFSDNAQKELLEFFENSVKGQNHRTMFIPLPADDQFRKVDFKMEPIESSVQEASFDKYQVANRDEILMAHRVPISKIGIPNGVSLAMARDADKTFKEQVCNPVQQHFENRINKIVREFTDIVVFKLNELTLTDEDTQATIDERYLRMQVVTPNEVRSRRGMPAIHGGDDVVVLNARSASEVRSQANRSRARDRERDSQATDSRGEARSPQGEGRSYE